ncbi:hypothetical protein NQ095_19205 [Rossellomorea sp. SC111]|uniref:hypothetical protein n=1 Tax=Rossellomorea sp. SC111 TaxID=2968985 RepID=UPI00215AA3B7|nr:hypothetical protein [Rossellomorea sp. SC111]MCR8850552.1 hypothetical protein [Rossellomorea sp. SC111]
MKKIKEELEKIRKEIGKRSADASQIETKTQMVSVVTTDQHVGVLNLSGKFHGPHYLAHTTIEQHMELSVIFII